MDKGLTNEDIINATKHCATKVALNGKKLRMDKKLTNEDIINAAKHCTTNANCDNCPFFAIWGIKGCIENFAQYIVNNTKNEPALSANSTSSEVSKDTNSTHLDDSTKEQICQAYDTADKACTDILLIYDEMSECEQRAFDIGEVYGKICSTRDKLENLRGAN
ncbi:hypothetical protein [uncultured Ruminococcus sp.]|uniref:hypothetical protein n=1 Tax=uncultured Ruminococcus sp. TaxID=165186 RepID=UPI0026140EC3|nr:hypothetical protein [uncultured Ruminococcus sp.]